MKTNEPFITDAVVRRDVYRVFRLTPAQADRVSVLTADDVVSRQSVTVRDAKSLGLKGADRYVVAAARMSFSRRGSTFPIPRSVVTRRTSPPSTVARG